MAEGPKAKTWEEVYQSHRQRNLAKIKLADDIRTETIARLTTDPDIQSFFEQYSATSVDDFINQYAHKKGLMLANSDDYENMSETFNTEYIDKAEDCLKEIQYKKLYNLYCQWAAELVTVEGVEVAIDFMKYAEDIFNCPVIDPITRGEFELYLKYAGSNDFTTELFFNWTEVADVRSDDNEEEDEDEGNGQLPPWFMFNNTHTGDNKYMQLPNIRNDKEMVYRRLFHEDFRKELVTKEAAGEISLVRDTRPILSAYSYDTVRHFMLDYEDAPTVRKFEMMAEQGAIAIENIADDEHTVWLKEQVEYIIIKLDTLNLTLPVEASHDWREALVTAWDKYGVEQTIEALHVQFDKYLFRIDNKISFASPEAPYFEGLIKEVRRQILKGRVLNGEPEDFNF
jgi:hypothetical protein